MEHIELYRKEVQERARERKSRAAKAMLAVAGAGLLICILLCVFTTRKNEGVMLPLTIGTSVLAGWIVIFLSHAVYGEANATVRHMEAMYEGERETVCGRFTKTGDVYRIRHGVTMRRVRFVSEDGHDSVLNICESLQKDLPDTFCGRADTVYGFIVAYEVTADV